MEGKKDPRTIARKYQLELCKKAVEENIIVYLGTGCGKTHIAVLLMYELGHLIRAPSRKVCVFLAPTVPLVRQQAIVIESSTDFTVQSYSGNHKNSKDHSEWDKEIEQSEVLVMTPQILLHNLRHCFIKMDLIALLVFDECHHAQSHKRHPYAQIMKEFYKSNGSMKTPRIFGMTASPIIGKGGSNPLNYTRCINSLERLLDAKVCSVDEDLELDGFVASPDMKVYVYGLSVMNSTYHEKLQDIRSQCMCMIGERVADSKDRQKKIRLLWKMHDNLIFCLDKIGLWGSIIAVRILLSSERFESMEMEADDNNNDNCLNQYLSKAASALSCNVLNSDIGPDSLTLETLEEPFISAKLSVLIAILSNYRLKENMKCIIFVKRIIAARSLAYILGRLKSLDFWKCEFLVGYHSGLKSMSRRKMSTIVEKFSSGQVNLLVATNVAEEGLDIQTCCLVVRYDLPETVASFIQSRGRARMLKSEYVFLVERGNQCEEKLLKDFISGEKIMNEEIVSRSSTGTFADLEEKIYQVYSTGASISTGCSVSLLHRYCDKLPRDVYFTPSPKFFYIDDISGTVCRIILPPNVPLRQIDSPPCSSKDEAKRLACLKACIELHSRGSLTDYLLPGLDDAKKKGVEENAECGSNGADDCLGGELHEMLIPAALKMPWTLFDTHVLFYFYYIRFVPVPEDRLYRKFGLFLKAPLPEEAEAMEVDLHLAHGRIVKSNFVPSGMLKLDKEEIILAQNFQEMFLKIILDRSDFYDDFVPLAKIDDVQQSSSKFYLLLPVKENIDGDNLIIDWITVRRCLSSPVFRVPSETSKRGFTLVEDTLQLSNGAFEKCDIMSSLIFTPHNKLFFFTDGIIDGISASSAHKGSRGLSYAEYYRQRFNIQLNHPDQPFLKAKQLFSLRNLLHNRLQEKTESREQPEHFVELPPELCSLKIIGFSKDVGSSLSLLPSVMHRFENLLVAVELKDVFSASFPEGSQVRAACILEALTTEKCLERLSLERYEVLGDAFLKYVVGRHSFLSYEGLDEGQLTKKRSSIVNNSHLYELAIRKRLQVYIRDAWFEPSEFFALGRPCKVVCNADNESIVHCQQGKDLDGSDKSNIKCTRCHQWLQRKTIADVVEALVGAFLVESGFKAAIAFLRWIGVEVDFDVRNIHRIYKESEANMSLIDNVDVAALEALIGYKFQHRGLLLQALIHPSYNKHSGGCYQKLEFLGDAVLEYLITSYLYSVYPDLKPGQITDLRSISVNNNSFAHIAVLRSLHLHLIKDSSSLTEAIRKFEKFVDLSDSEKELEEPPCPKVLGDMVESCIGAVLLDSGFDMEFVWKAMLSILEPTLSFSSLQLNPIREVHELCQFYNFKLTLPSPTKVPGGYFVEVEVDAKGELLKFGAKNPNSKAARRSTAQDMIAVLKARGYRQKSKTLEEIVRLTTKKKPQLIGYDEDTIVIDYRDSIDIDELVIGESEETYNFPPQTEASSSTCSEVNHKQSSATRSSFTISHAECSLARKSDQHQNGKVVGEHQIQPNGSADDMSYQEATGVSEKKTAKSLLYETCASNYWTRPSFVLVKEEGPPHLRMFTYMARVHVETVSTMLECVSEPKTQRRAAQDHAAEGALWYLKHLGYLPEA